MKSRGASWLTIVALLLGTEWLNAQEMASSAELSPPAVSPAASNYLAFVQQPTNTTGGKIISPPITVQLKDRLGNNLALAGVVVTMTKTTGTGTLSGATKQLTDAKGLATFPDLSIDLSGSKRLTAAASGYTSAVSNSFTISVGPAARLRIQTEPSSTATAGVVFAQQPIIYIEDAGGNRVTTDNSTVVTAARLMGEGTLQGILTAKASSGIATFTNLSHNVADTITILFSSGTLTQDTSRSIIISPASAARLAFLQQPTDAMAGAVISPAVTVEITDAYGNLVKTTGTSIALALYTGTGVLSGTLTRTTTSGVATFNNLSINLTGAKTLRATSGSLTAAVSNPFNISPRPAKKLVIIQQPTDAIAGAYITPPVTVQIRDSLNNDVPVSGVGITMMLASGTGNLIGTKTRSTSTAGLATFDDLSIDSVGSKTLSASSTGLTSATSTAFAITAGTASQLVFAQQPTTTRAGDAIAPAVTVQLKDAYGNNVRKAGVTVTVALDSGAGPLTGTLSQLTDASGLASFNNLILTASGVKRLAAASTGFSAAISNRFSITPASASKLAFTTHPGGGTAGTPFATQPVVTLEDAFGNPVTGVAQTVTLAIQHDAGPGGTLLGTRVLSVSTTTGRAVFTNIAIDKAGNGYTLTATGSTVSTVPGTVVSNPFQVTAGSPTKVRVENAPDGTGTVLGSQNITSGTSVTVHAIARDANDNFVANVPADAWTLSSITGGVLPTDLVASADRRSATFTGRQTGTAVINATRSGLTPVPSGTLTVVHAGSPTQIRVETAANGTGTLVPDRTLQSGSGLTVYAIGRDAAGNFIANLAADSWTLTNKTGGVANGDLIAAADSKSATFTGKLVGTARIQAIRGTLDITPSGILTVLAGPATSIAASAGTPQSTPVATAFPVKLAAQVRDAAGNPAFGVLVSWVAPVSGASATFAPGGSAASTDSNGVATSGILTANIVAGSYQVVASLPTGAATALYSLTNIYGTPAHIATTAGSPQTARVTRQFATPLEAVVTDSSGNVVGGVSVTFVAPATEASGTFAGGSRSATVTTNASGVATAPSFTANSVVGSYRVTATTSGVPGSAAFELSNIAGSPGVITQASGTPQSVAVGSVFPVTLSAIVTDSSGNHLPGVYVLFAAPSSGASGRFAEGIAETVMTDASGRATASPFTANTLVGSYVVLAQLPGLVASAPFYLANLPGTVDTFLIDAMDGTPIGRQIALTPFNVRVRAADRYGNVSTTFSGTANITSNGPMSQAGSTTAPFVQGVLASHTIAMQTAGRFYLMATRTGGAETGQSDTFDVVNPVPTIAKLLPAVGRRGQSLSVTVTGSGFLPGVTTVSFGDKIATSTIIVSGTEMTVSLDIDTAAVTGPRDVIVFNGPPGGGGGTLPGGFQVINNPSPSLTSIVPDTATVLQRLTVVLSGANFFEDVTHLNIGPGISLNAVTVDSSTHMTADISITDPSAGGLRMISVANASPGGGVSGSVPFRIGAPPASYPVPVFPTDGSAGVDTILTFRWHQWLRNGVRYHLEISTDETFATPVLSDSSVADTMRQVSTLTRGSTYYWRVTATNAVGSSDPSPVQTFSIYQVYPPSLTLADTIRFPLHASPAEYLLTDYRMVGLPGNCNIPVRNFLTGSQNAEWAVYWDTGAQNDYLLPYDGSATFNFVPGRAFWILQRGPLSIRTTVSTLPLDSTRSVTIPLHSGWNLITNPFVSAVPWQAVQAANGPGSLPVIWEFDGSFKQASSFKACAGYLFDNVDNRAGIRIPLGWARGKSTVPEETMSWHIQIRLEAGLFVDEATSIGVSPLASDGRDPLDLRMPRGPADRPGIVFERPEWNSDGDTYATDIRSDSGSMQVWTLNARCPAHTPALLSLSGVADVPPQYQVLLVDDDCGRSADLRENPQYNFVPITPVSHLRIAIGTDDAIQAMLTALLPKESALQQNFPNPFNPTTVISCQLAVAGRVRLVVYDVLGREVATLLDEWKDAGRYQIEFDGSTLATGVYICRLTAGSFVDCRKLLLLK